MRARDKEGEREREREREIITVSLDETVRSHQTVSQYQKQIKQLLA